METKKKWYQKTGWIIALLVLFFPVGLFLMWKYANWNKVVKWVITGFFALMVIANMGSGSKTASTTTTPENTPTATQETQPTTEPEVTTPQEQTTQPTKAPAKATAAPARATNTPAAQQSGGATTSQKNAVRKAQSYLSYSGFSRDGLVAQLEFEKFSRADAEYGADNSGGNWNEEAAQKAKSYMDMQGYSRDGLIQQLLFEKFTQAQAEYGANSVGL